MPEQKAPLLCRTCQANGRDTEIFFLNANKSKNGKMIPIEVATKQNHTCPFRAQNTGTILPGQMPAPSPGPTNTPKPAAAVDISVIAASVTKAVEDYVKMNVKPQLDRIEQAVAGLLMQPTGTPTDKVPQEKE